MADKEQEGSGFKWSDLGDIALGRPNLGQDVPVLVYRLLQYTFQDALIAEVGEEKANDIFVKAGRIAGSSFCKNMLDVNLDFDEFVASLQKVLKELAIGVLRIEKADRVSGRYTVTVAEDLDCSGLPFSDEVVCQYDEGFLAGVFETHTGRPFIAKEIDCWANGGRVCRFDVWETGSST